MTRGRVDPAGLRALRLAVAMTRDPLGGLDGDRVFYRVAPIGTGTSASAGPLSQPGAPAIESTVAATAVPTAAAELDAVPSQPYPTDTEQARVMGLLESAQNGDGEAFGQLYDRYVDMVYRYVAYRVGSHTLAEDLTSETFMKALRSIGSFRWQGRDFGAWLITIARNLIADHYKSSRYKLEMTTADLVEAGVDGHESGPEDEVLNGITNARLLEAVRSLRPEQQECIVLRFLQGMSVAETALVLRKNEQAVKALQYRAVKALGRILPAELVA